MPPSSKTWSRQEGSASKRKRPSAHDFFDDSKKRARPEADRAEARACSPKTPRDSENVVRGKVGSVSFTPYSEGHDPQDAPPKAVPATAMKDKFALANSRQYSPLFVSSTNECNHDNQTNQFTTRDYPLSPLSHSPEHISDGCMEPTKRPSRQSLYGSFSAGDVTRLSRVSTSETERESSMAPSTIIVAKSNTPISRNVPPQANSQSTQQMAIVESLADFARFMTSASTLEVKNDLLKQQAATEEQKRRRLQKCRSGFDFLDNEDDYRVEAVTKSVVRLEQQIQLHQHNQLEIATNLAAKLQNDQDIPLGSEKPETSDDVNVIKEELVKIGRELENTRAEIGEVKQNSLVQVDLDKQLETLVTRDDVQYHVNSTEQRVAQIVADFQKDCQANRDINNQHTQRLDGFNIRLEEKERDVHGLAEKIRDQRTTVGLLDALVRGNSTNDDPGLKDLIMDGSSRLSAMQARIQKTESDMQQLGNRVSQMQMLQNPDEDSTWRKDLDALRQEMNDLHNSHVEQQRAEFDFLASDLERLDDHAKNHTKEIEDLERSHAEKIENLKRFLSTTSRPQPPPTPPLTNMSSIPDEPYQRKLKDLETRLHRLSESQKVLDQFKERFDLTLNHLSNRTTAMETMSVAQQQKFDGLTTDHLFTSIINHLHNMYPNLPVNLAARVAEIVLKLQTFEQFLGGINQRLNQTDFRLNQADQRHAALQSHSLEMATVLNGLKPELARLKDVTLDKEMCDRVDQLERRLEDLKTESSAEIEKCSTNVATIRSDIAVLKEQPQVAMATMEDLRRRASTALDESSSDSGAQAGDKRKRVRIEAAQLRTIAGPSPAQTYAVDESL